MSYRASRCWACVRLFGFAESTKAAEIVRQGMRPPTLGTAQMYAHSQQRITRYM